MELLGGLLSPFVMRVVLGARFKGHSLAVRPAGDLKSDDYRALNPMGKIPTLVVDGWALPESSVILEYLDETLDGAPLLPAAPRERAVDRLLARVVDLYVVPHLVPLFRAASEPEGVAAAREGLGTGLGYLDTLRGDRRPWAVGEAPGVADCTLMPVAFFLEALDRQHDTLSAMPERLERWWSHAGASSEGRWMKAEMHDAMARFLAGR